MDNFDKLYNKALHFLSFRPRSEKEIIDYLKKKTSYSKTSNEQEGKEIEKMISLIIEKLKNYKFIDDFEFTRWWIEQRTKIRPKSLKFIKFELKQKGILSDLVQEVLEDKDFEVESDLDKALKLAKQKLPKYKKDVLQKQKEKLFRYLSGKGFDYDIIKEVVDRILAK